MLLSSNDISRSKTDLKLWEADACCLISIYG